MENAVHHRLWDILRPSEFWNDIRMLEAGAEGESELA